MADKINPNPTPIHPGMTLLDTVAQFPATEDVIRSRDEQAGKCLLCSALFDTIGQVAQDNGLDLASLLNELNAAASR